MTFKITKLNIALIIALSTPTLALSQSTIDGQVVADGDGSHIEITGGIGDQRDTYKYEDMGTTNEPIYDFWTSATIIASKGGSIKVIDGGIIIKSQPNFDNKDPYYKNGHSYGVTARDGGKIDLGKGTSIILRDSKGCQTIPGSSVCLGTYAYATIGMSTSGRGSIIEAEDLSIETYGNGNHSSGIEIYYDGKVKLTGVINIKVFKGIWVPSYGIANGSVWEMGGILEINNARLNIEMGSLDKGTAPTYALFTGDGSYSVLKDTDIYIKSTESNLESNYGAYGIFVQQGTFNSNGNMIDISIDAINSQANGISVKDSGNAEIKSNLLNIDVTSINTDGKGETSGLYIESGGEVMIDSLNPTQYSRWHIKADNTKDGEYTSAYGILREGEDSKLTLKGNHSITVESLKGDATGIKTDSGKPSNQNLVQKGNLILNVSGAEKTIGIHQLNGVNNVSLENVVATVNSLTPNGTAYGIYSESTADSSILSIKGNRNSITTNGIGIGVDKSSLEADVANLTLVSTSNKAFEVKKGSNLNLEANKSTFVGNSQVDADSEFNLKLLDGSRWNIMEESTVTELTNQSGSMVDLRNSSKEKFNNLTVTADYIGGNATNAASSRKGAIMIRSLWNNESDFKTDTLVIKGTATDYTEVQTNDDLIGNIIPLSPTIEQYSGTVITVDDHKENRNAFYGFGDTKGAEQAIIKQRNANEYSWYLIKYDEQQSSGMVALKPEVSGYLATAQANMNLGFSMIGSLHQREGSQSSFIDNAGHTGFWGRIIANHSEQTGKNRFDYDSDQKGIQLGYHFGGRKEKAGESSFGAGVTFSYVQDSLKFNDRRYVMFDTSIGNYVERDQRVGKGRSNAYLLGGYYTFYSGDNAYLDLVGQVDYIKNSYDSMRNNHTNNKSYGITLSAEVGKSFTLGSNSWRIEPQAQLMYQYRRYSDITALNDISVTQKNRSALKGRLGVRLEYQQADSSILNNVYVVANVIHQFTGGSNNKLKFGHSDLKENFSETYGELGVGAEFRLNKDRYIYGDVRYHHSLGSNKGSQQGYSANIGLKWLL